MKIGRKISFVILLLIMGFMVVKSLQNSNSTTAEAASGYNVSLYNGNEEAGNIVYYLVDAEGEKTSDALTSGKVKYGQRIKVEFAQGLKDGYSVNLWANTNGVTFTTVKSGDEIYTKDYLTITVKEDVGIYVMAICSTDKVATFYETSAIAQASVVGYGVLNADGSYTQIAFTPIRQGFDFKGWSESILDIENGAQIYPKYDSNVFTIFRDYWDVFLKGLGMTILLAIISIALSLALGISLCLLNMSNNKILKYISSAYIEVIRGVPSLLLLLLVYCVVGPTKIHIGSFFTTEILSCILALFLNSSAYTAEIFRSGIQAVDAGQTEAGRALGLSKWQVIFKIVLPQGLKNALPSLCNELIMIIKETSLAYSINNAIGELMCAKVSITSKTGDALSPYLIIAVIYFIVTFSLSQGVKYLEKRLA